MKQEKLDDNVLPNETQVVSLDCKNAFNALTKSEKLYAHYLSRASWHGGLIALLQTSPESPLMFCLLHKIFSSESIDSLRKKNSNLSDDEFKAFLVYTCGIFSNMGNYKSFGDTKFVPSIDKEKFEQLIVTSKAYNSDPGMFHEVWDYARPFIYALEPNQKSLGFPDKGITTYFSSNFSVEDSELVNEYLKNNCLEGYNCRTFKTVKEGEVAYEIRLASRETGFDPSFMKASSTYKGATFKMTRNDYSEILDLVIEDLLKAMEYTANPVQKNMIEKYVESFKSGNLDYHKDGSRFWVKDKSPIIETYIGFIETYRDPSGIRGEFEGFVAMVNKDMSKKFTTLVSAAQDLIKKLPWGHQYEKDEFLQPDFTSLDVLTFAGSGIPAGINIPNYDDIRQVAGFKNVSLGNVIPATYKNNDFFFLTESDKKLMMDFSINAFEIQVGLHELLGHGSGKLFRHVNGTYNFPHESVIEPFTSELVTSYYEEGETYDGVFTDISSSYEECRAECVGLYLSLDPDVLRIFGYEGQEAEDVTYVNWLNLLWAGTGKALEMYNPHSKTWLQAHSQARFVITQVILEAGEGLFSVSETKANEELLCSLNRSKIATVGKRAIGEFLLKLQVYKSTRNVKAAREMYSKYSQVTDEGLYPWARWRNIIMLHKKPRKMFVQCNTFNQNGNINLTEYEPTHEGLIKSWVDRFDDDKIYEILKHLYEKDSHHFVSNKHTNQ